MNDTDKPGTFFLGREIDPKTLKEKKNLLFESKNLTTHAVCVGMTGSGKTGLGITLLEEAGLNQIPAIIIDPKGDLSNLLLTFPNLSSSEFKPWIDSAEAQQAGLSADAYSEKIAKTWKDGLAAWGEDVERIKRFRAAVDVAIYTPANQAGIPISILNSFSAPSNEELNDPTALRDKVLSVTASLLGLLGINADPVKSREQILISTIIQEAWQKGENLDIASLIQKVQKPPFTKVGALDIDTFYPAKDRLALSINLNNLLASPGFQAWMEGVPLDIEKLLYTNDKKPKLSIISIAHLSDSERMFFVTLLLNAFISWMRLQPGTSSLRTLLYMDEIFGFFPPIAAPPSKQPMLTLLKQARAFGVGIVLATQNPVDLDYKGLSNCGTWFIGKLQTERDQNRVLEGLKIASNGQMDAKELDKLIAMTGKRKFIMSSIYEKQPLLFETRWTLSYLKGPLTLNQIASLEIKKPSYAIKKEAPTGKPAVPPNIDEFFVNHANHNPYEAKLLGMAKVHYVNAKCKIDVWEEVNLVLPVETEVNWEEASSAPNLKQILKKEPLPNSSFKPLNPILSQEKNYSNFAKQLATTLYQNQTYTIYQTANPNLISNPGESEADFRKRVTEATVQKKEELIKKIKEKYADKIDALSKKIARTQDKAEQKKQTAFWQKIQAGILFIFTILGAALSGKVTKGAINQTGTSIRRATRMTKNSEDAAVAEGEVATYQNQLQDLENQMHDEIDAITSNINIETTTIRPRKSDIDVQKVCLVWWA